MMHLCVSLFIFRTSSACFFFSSNADSSSKMELRGFMVGKFPPSIDPVFFLKDWGFWVQPFCGFCPSC
jgi:hypothetical protein